MESVKKMILEFLEGNSLLIIRVSNLHKQIYGKPRKFSIIFFHTGTNSNPS